MAEDKRINYISRVELVKTKCQDFPRNFSGWPNESRFQLCVRR